MKSTILIATLFAPTALSGAVPEVIPRRSTTRLEDRNTGYLGEQNLQSDALARAAGKIQLQYQKEEKKDQWKKCNPSNIITRREWSTFKDSEKLDYTRAVKCLSKLPSKTPKSECPGCKSRYDDFVATHIKQAFTIHLTGNFLAWHRWYVYEHEQALRDECGYKGYQPYYNWPRWASDPMKSPLLDNSPTSISGNGQPACPNQTFFGIPDNINPLFKIPAGNGGGCVTGPFKDWPINIGPGVTGSRCTTPNPISNFTDPNFGLGYNPRCLKRDISAWAASTGSSDADVVKLLNSTDIKTFWADMQGGLPSFANGYMGVHTTGHYTIGGDPGSDFMASPYDPYFFFHHAQVDRVWWAWQNAEPKTRTDAIYGPLVLGDFSTPNATLADEMTIGYAASYKLKIGETMSTMAGLFCYRYE